MGTIFYPCGCYTVRDMFSGKTVKVCFCDVHFLEPTNVSLKELSDIMRKQQT